MDRETLDDLLGRWGAFHAARSDYRGYPTRSVFASLTDPHYFRPQSRALIRDAPPWVWPVDRAVARIDRPYREAIFARYALPPVDGRLLSERQIASLIGISRSAYRQRLYRARRALMTLVHDGHTYA